MRIVQRNRLGEIARVVKRANGQLLELIHVLIQLHVQRAIGQRGKQHTVDLHPGDTGQIVLRIDLEHRAVDGRGDDRRGQVNALYLGAFLKLMAVRIGHAERKNTIRLKAQFGIAAHELIFTVNPAAVIHAVFDFVPAKTVFVRHGHLHDSLLIAAPAARCHEDNPVRRNRLLRDRRGFGRGFVLCDGPNRAERRCHRQKQEQQGQKLGQYALIHHYHQDSSSSP